ncbi:hypothetical protein [Geodermatophilus chilensis]|jgi:hypothetical protein|uniref:hypothetical protein n=1 Tax=Geodermatophilus chilensis TaxID=2035835 RepID=UPI000C26978E|nr:hypothetical protein [Geodermatophilus chilensis]
MFAHLTLPASVPRFSWRWMVVLSLTALVFGFATAPAAQAAEGLHYRGILTIAIRHLDACGADLGEAIHEVPVDAFVNPGVGDGNPFVLQVSEPSVAANLAEGSVLLQTTGVTATSQGPLFLHYWDLQFDGLNVSGQLVQDHVEEAAAGNLLTSSAQLVPCRPSLGVIPSMDAIAEGSALAGTVTEGQVQLQVVGNVTTGLRPFSAVITADRIG